MTRPLEGIRVIDAGMWGFGPIAAGVMADWGADVIKVEHPAGDPFRSFLPGQVHSSWHQLNRGKRGIAIDLATEDGQRVLQRLVAGADVFMTSFLPASRRRLRIDVEDIRAANPSIIYARASAHGPRGPEADKGGYDPTAFWARSGAAMAAMSSDDAFPPQAPRGGLYGDYSGGHMLVGGILAALIRRARTGEPAVVDGSLYGCGIWALGWNLIGHAVGQIRERCEESIDAHLGVSSALSNTYRTSDDRFIIFRLHESDRGGSPRWWAELCQCLGREDVIEDPRFSSPDLRRANVRELVELLDDVFAGRTYVEWLEALRPFNAPWSQVAAEPEVVEDPQALANGYFKNVTLIDGHVVPLVASPIQIDETSPDLVRAPELGEHTDELLAEVGYGPDEIASLRDAKAIG